MIDSNLRALGVLGQLMSIDTTFLRRGIDSLDLARSKIAQQRAGDDSAGDLYRAACAKEFERVLEQSGKLLRKRLAAYFASNRQADRLTFKDLFRHATKHGIMEADAAERWLAYRDHRHDTAHSDGEVLAEATLTLLPTFIADARALAATIEAAPHD